MSMNVRIFVKMMTTSFHAVTSKVDLDEILKTLGGGLNSQDDAVDATTTKDSMIKEQQQYQRNIAAEKEEDRIQAGIDELKVVRCGSNRGHPVAGVSENKEKDEIPAKISAEEPKVSTVKKNRYQSKGK